MRPARCTPSRRQKPECPACGQRVILVKTAASGGVKRTMCDPEWHRGDGRKTLVTRDGRQIVKAPPEVLGREPHWGTCPRRQELIRITRS